MKIGIVGNYGKGNHGDEAILEGILVQLEDAYQIERKDIVVFSANPIETHSKFGVQAHRSVEKRRTLPMKILATLIHHKPIIKELDVLLIGGGGIMMDLYKAMPVRYAIYALLAKMARTPSVVYGPGAGPISTFYGKKLIKFIADSAEIVMVRDENSKELLHKIGVKKQIQVITDPAFFVRTPKKVMTDSKTFNIGVTSVAYYDKDYWPTEDKIKYENYVNGMASNLNNVLKQFSDAQINFFSTKHPYDTNVAIDIKSRMNNKEKCAVITEEMNHLEIVDFVNQQDLVIGTRLHSLILSLGVKTPIIAVSYHHKVKDFMESIGYNNLCLPIEELHLNEEDIANILLGMRKDWGETRKEFKNLSYEIKTQEPRGTEQLKLLIQ